MTALVGISMTDYVLLQTLQESIVDVGRLKAIFVCGIPGAGKTYTVSQLQDGAVGARIVNSDRMYEFLGKQGHTNVTDPTGWKAVSETVKRTTSTQLQLYINSMLPLFVDSTSADPGNILRRKGILESIGYDVGIVWVETDVETAVARARERERQVPEEFIRRVHERAERTKQYVYNAFQWKLTINNNDGELTDNIIQSAYKAAQGFFRGPVENPMGQHTIKQLETERQKYLVPNVCSKEELSHYVAAWYKK